MKYLLLLFFGISFSQTENTSVKYNTIYFTESIKNDSTYISKLTENPKINIIRNKGNFKNAKCSCKGNSIFMRQEFNFEFTIKENNVEVYNIRFLDNTKEIPLEDYALKDDKTIRNSNIFIKNYKCFNEFFQEIFNF